MGFRTLRSCLEQSRSSGSDRLALLVLAERANDSTGDCWPSVETIALEANLRPRAVQYALKRLVELGELTIDVHGAPVNGPRQYRPNRYTVAIASGASPCISSAPPVVHGGAPPVVHAMVASGAPERRPVVHGGAPKPEENHKEPLVVPPAEAHRDSRPRQRATDDPVTARAHALAVVAFDPKLVRKVPPGKRERAFPKVLGIIRGHLDAGESDEMVRAAIDFGVDTWSFNGLGATIGIVRRRSPVTETSRETVTPEVLDFDRSYWERADSGATRP